MDNNRFSEQLELAARQLTAEREYWLKELSGVEGGYGFPADATGGDGKYECGELSLAIPGPTYSLVEKVSRGSVHALHVLLTATVGVLLSRYLDTGDVVLGTTIFRQGDSAGKQFSNLCVPLKLTGVREMTVKNLLNTVKGAVKGGMANYRYPIEILTRELLGAQTGGGPSEKLFDAGVLVENIQEEGDFSIYPPNILFLFRSNEGGVDGRIRFNRCLYGDESVERLKGRFLTLLRELCTNLGALVDDIEMSDDSELRLVLESFNNTGIPFNREITVHEWFERTALRFPEKLAVGGDGDGAALTFRRLHELSGGLASTMIRLGVRRGSVVAIMAEPSHYLVIGILATLKAGAAYLPVDPLFPKSRRSYMMADSRAALLLGEGHLLEELPEEGYRTLQLDDDGSYEEGEPAAGAESSQRDLLYVIYTSGTTGKPKGVQLEHRNLVNYVSWFSGFAGITEADQSMLVSSFAFDLGYTALYPSLLNGGTIHILPRDDYMDPDILLEYVARHRITYLKMTPSMFNVLAHAGNFSPAACSSLRLVVLGGEAIVVQDVETAHQACPHIRFVNHYGPTEATIGCIARNIDFEDIDDYRRRPTIGKPIANTQVYIWDSRQNIRPAGLPGELCIAGEGLARGYLNRPETTVETFIEDAVLPGQRLYRTGDLARFTSDGMVEFLGRVDHQVKIRGYRIELGEIENRLAAHPAVGDTIVLVQGDAPRDKHIVAYVVPKEKDSGGGTLRKEMIDYCSASLPSYMIPAFFVFLDQLPLNANGKVDRRALPQPTVEVEQNYQAPADEIETALVNLWAAVLDIEAAVIGTQANFFALGGQSLKATVLAADIQREFSVRVPLTDIFQNPTVAGLAQCVRSAQKESYAAVRPTEKKEYYELSSAQKRLFVLQQMEPEGTVYNRPKVSFSSQTFQRTRFQEAARRLVRRHETLRTSFLSLEDPVQRIHEDVPVEMESFDLTASSSTEETRERVGATMREFIRPFDLSRPPLFRIGLAALPEGRFALMTDMHHIICDGMSQGVMERDFTALLNGEVLEPLTVQYRDFSQWQNREKAAGSLEPQRDYWLSQFSDTIPALNMPQDYSRPPLQSFEGDVLRFQLDNMQSQAIQRLASTYDATLFMVLLAMFHVLLGKLSGQEDIVTGVPIAGRRQPELQDLIGMFVNTLVLRSAPQDRKSFAQLLREVKDLTIEAFENQDYQFEDLVEQVVVERDPSRNPLFDVMFSMMDLRNPGGIVDAASQTDDAPGASREAKFDLTLSAGESAGIFYFTFEYCVRLFKKETIQRFADYFKRIVDLLTAAPDTWLGAVSLLDHEERRRILEEFNDTAVPGFRQETAHQLIHRQSRRSPDAVAVAHRHRCITYRRLDEDANILAAVLQKRGVSPDEIIGICGGRGIAMVTGILAILKAGGAYLPISEHVPPDRITYMVRDCNTRLVLTADTREPSNFGTAGVDVLPVESLAETLASAAEVGESHDPEALAYVIYTSGSTGQAKGVAVHHAALANTVCWFNDRYAVSAYDRVLQATNIAFDVSVEEIFTSLTAGAALLVMDSLAGYGGDEFLNKLRAYGPTIAQFVPLVMFELLSEGPRLESIRVLICGGDRLDENLKDRMVGLGYNLHNHYGPTETCIDALAAECGIGGVVIGKPVANTAVYVMAGGQMLSTGLMGALCISGANVARGYLNNPEATAGAFVKDPFNGDRRMYKTGDLARLTADGNIEFLGRADLQVKIRGFRIELGEIENRLLQLSGVQNAAVLAREYENGEKYLCGYVATGGDFDEERTRVALQRHLPPYMIPAYFVPLDTLPLTANGKIDRKALPVPRTESAGEPSHLADAVEERLAAIWSDILGIEPSAIGSSSDFFRLGGHSLRATVLVGRIHREFDCEIPLNEIFRHSTVKGQGELVRAASNKTFVAVRPAEKRDYYPLSPAQKRLYIMQTMEPAGTAYNIPHVSTLGRDVDHDRLADVFARLIRRHHSLRTAFSTIESVPVQRIHETIDFQIEEIEVPAGTEPSTDVETVVRDFVRPFDLSRPPLLRAGVLPLSGGGQVLIVDMHHIVSDGTSMEVLLQDFHALLKGEALAPLSLQYVDYAEWLRGGEFQEKTRRQESYWRGVLGDKPPHLDLPLDFPRPEVAAFAGKRLLVLLSEAQSRDIVRLASEEGATVYMVMLAVFYIFLSRVSGQDDICVGTPTAGRPHPDLERIVGMFVNTLVLRRRPVGDERFMDFLALVRQRTLEAFENQDLQFEAIVELFSGARESGRNPLFDVMFEHSRVNRDWVSGEGDDSLDRPTSVSSKFDLILNVLQYNNRILVGFTYNKALFEMDTIRRFSGYYREILEQATGDRQLEIKDIKISLELCHEAVEVPDMDLDF